MFEKSIELNKVLKVIEADFERNCRLFGKNDLSNRKKLKFNFEKQYFENSVTKQNLKKIDHSPTHKIENMIGILIFWPYFDYIQCVFKIENEP